MRAFQLNTQALEVSYLMSTYKMERQYLLLIGVILSLHQIMATCFGLFMVYQKFLRPNILKSKTSNRALIKSGKRWLKMLEKFSMKVKVSSDKQSKSRMSTKVFKITATKVDLSSLSFQKLKTKIPNKLNSLLQCFTLFQISLKKTLNKLRNKELMKNKTLKFHHSCQTTVRFSYQIKIPKIMMKLLSPTSNN